MPLSEFQTWWWNTHNTVQGIDLAEEAWNASSQTTESELAAQNAALRQALASLVHCMDQIGNGRGLIVQHIDEVEAARSLLEGE